MKNKLRNGSGNAAVGTAIIVIVMIIVFGATFAWMYSVDLLFLPDFIEDILKLDRNDDTSVFANGELSEIVRTGKNERGEVVTFDDTYENLRAALLSEPASEGIYLSADVCHYADGEPVIRRIRYFRDGERFRAEICAPGDDSVTELLKIADSEQLTVADRAAGELRTVARGTDIVPENEAMIPSVTELLRAVEAFPEREAANAEAYGELPIDETSSDGEELSECDIKLVDTDKGKLYYVSFIYNDIGLKEEYFVSLDYRIIISANSFIGETPIYSYNIVRVSVDPDDYSEDTLYTVSKAS